MSQDRRRSRRTEMEVDVLIEEIVKPGEQAKSFPIHIQDISKSGVKFFAREFLEKDKFFHMHLIFKSKENVKAVIEVQWRKKEDIASYSYGARFVGLDDRDAFKIEIFQLFNDDDYMDEICGDK